MRITRRYRHIARECFELSQVVNHLRDRRELLKLASKWLERCQRGRQASKRRANQGDWRQQHLTRSMISLQRTAPGT